MMFTLSAIPGINYAQTSSSNRSVKMYSTYEWYKTSSVFPNSLRGDNSRDLGQSEFHLASPAIQWGKGNGEFWEVGLSTLRLHSQDKEIVSGLDSGNTPKVTGGAKTQTFQIGFNIEHNYRVFARKKDSRLRTYIGASANPFLGYYSNKPHISNSFPVSRTDFGIRLMVFPRLQYDISNKWFLDLNFPVSLAEITMSSQKVENPVFSQEQIRNGVLTLTLFQDYAQVRFGLGLRL